MTTRRLVFWITMLAIFAMAARISVDTDSWWHLRAGQWIVENRQVLQTDPFSYTRYEEAWHYPGWLAEVPMYAIYWAFGPGGLNLWTAAMVVLTFWFIWKTLTGGEFLRAFVLILAATSSGVYWAARPHLVTFVFSAAYLWILNDWSGDRAPSVSRRLWWLPVMMVLWANSHGGFAVGFIIWGVYFVGALASWKVGTFKRSNVQSLFVIGMLMVLAVCINPSGPVMLLYAFKTVNIGVLQDFIQEWQSPNFHEWAVQPFMWLVLILLGVLGASKQRIRLVDFLLLAGFGYLGFVAARNIALFALVAPMVLTRHAAPLLEELGERWGFRLPTRSPARLARGQSILNWILLGALILAVGLKSSLVIPRADNETHFRATLPVDAVEYIRIEQPAGRLFNSYNWGGYLLWALPGYPVFVDGRTDLYGDEIILQWIQVVQADEGWQTALDDWDVNLVLIEPIRPLARELGIEGWQLLYEDDLAVVYGR
ncbi:MAG: hypothetical protein H8E28_11730 [Anaerolineae bacterium]|nr:hypothetical protein [Anaerolineae bacterium]